MPDVFEADLIFSCGENNYLPVVDVWLVIDVLRATTVITRWFELGDADLYPVKTTEEARSLVVDLNEYDFLPILMGEVNGIPPEGFDLGNSPVELTYELIHEHSCGVMSTTNGTVALLEAASSGSPVIAVSFRNFSACLDHALTIGNKIGFLCSGRKKRPSWEDTLCAGAIIEKLKTRGTVLMTDSAKIALTLWQNRGEDLESFVKKSTHAEYLEKIGYDKDISFACKCDASTVVPMLFNEKNARPVLRKIAGNSMPYHEKNETLKPRTQIEKSELKRPSDPFEELLNYTKKPPEYFLHRKEEND